jgi:hypothetical protein
VDHSQSSTAGASQVCSWSKSHILCRFLYVIQYYIANGFYVAIDFHGGQGQIETDRQIVSNPQIFAQNWLALLTAIQSLPTYQQYLKGEFPSC